MEMEVSMLCSSTYLLVTNIQFPRLLMDMTEMKMQEEEEGFEQGQQGQRNGRGQNLNEDEDKGCLTPVPIFSTK